MSESGHLNTRRMRRAPVKRGRLGTFTRVRPPTLDRCLMHMCERRVGNWGTFSGVRPLYSTAASYGCVKPRWFSRVSTSRTQSLFALQADADSWTRARPSWRERSNSIGRANARRIRQMVLAGPFCSRMIMVLTQQAFLHRHPAASLWSTPRISGACVPR